MASVTAKVTFSCPHCDKVLKSSTRPVAGKKIKCPACDEVFVPEIDDEDEATGIQERPRLKSTSRETARDDNDVDDRPVRNKKAKQNSGSLMLAGLMLIGGGFLFLMCAGVGLGAFVWPGFLLSKPKEADKQVAKNDDAKPNDNPKPDAPQDNPGIPPAGNGPRAGVSAYILPDANVVMGMNVKGLRDANQLAGIMNLFNPGRVDLPPDVTDLAISCDKVLISMQIDMQANQRDRLGDPFGGPFAGAPGNTPKATMAVQMADAAAVERFKRMPGMLVAEKLPGKYAIYRQQNFNGPPMLLAMPTDRLIVFGIKMNEQEFTAILDRAAQNQAGVPALARMTALVEHSHFWASFVFDAPTRQKMRQGVDLTPLPPEAPFAAREWMNAVAKINGGAVAVDSLAGGNWKGTIHIDCDDALAARSLKDGADWMKMRGTEELRKPQLNPPPPSFVKDFNGLTLGHQATVVSASMTLSAPTVTEIAKLMPGGGLPKQPGFPNDFPPGPPPPPFNQPPPFKNPPVMGNLLNPPGPKAMQSFIAANLGPNATKEQGIHLMQGQRIQVSAWNNTPNKGQRNEVDFYVFRGDSSDNRNIIAFDQKLPNQQRNTHVTRVEFVVPETGPYFIRVANRGPGTTTQCIVNIEEFSGRK